jgi:tetratricopeptide (TPR) repeat protein
MTSRLGLIALAVFSAFGSALDSGDRNFSGRRRPMVRIRWGLILCIFAAAYLAEAPPAQGEDASWVGKSVVLTKRGVKIGQMGDDGKVHGDIALYRLVYEVKEAKGEWLLVSQGGTSGWLSRKDVIVMEEGAAYFTDRIRKDEKDDFAFGARGCVAWDKNNGEANADFDRAVFLNPKDPMWLRKRGEGWYGKHEFGKAITDLNEALRLEPSCPEALQFRGWAYFAVGERQKAMADFDNVVRLCPNWADAFVARGYAWFLTWDPDMRRVRSTFSSLDREFDEAIADLSEAVRLDPTSVNALHVRGFARMAAAQFDKAADDYNNAVRLAPKNAQLFYERATIWIANAEFDRAISDLDEAVRLDPKHAEAFMRRGDVRYAQRKYDLAITDYDESIHLDPKLCDALNNRASAWVAKGEVDKAFADLNEAVRINPSFGTAFVSRGTAWLNKKEYRKALADFDEAVRLQPESDSALGRRALFLATCPDEKFRDGKQSLVDAGKACALTDWKITDYLATLAAACAETGNFDQAVQWQTKVVDHWTQAKQPVEEAQKRLALYKDHKPYRGD